MGRPLKKKFFNGAPGQTFGGEGVSTLTFSNRGAGYYLANVAITLSAPQLPGGTQATVSSITLFGNGAINTYTVTGGSGYTTAPSVTITGANATPAVATSTLTSAVTNVIAVSAYVVGGSSAKAGDIVKQTGARTYKVTTADGTSKCKLVTAAPAAGQMTIAATDSLGSTYYVKKLEERVVTLVQNSDGGSGFEFATGARAKWSLAAAVAGTVQVASN